MMKISPKHYAFVLPDLNRMINCVLDAGAGSLPYISLISYSLVYDL